MTINDTKKILILLSVDYPRLISEQLDERLILWSKALEQYEYAIVEVAVKQVLINCKFEPKIGDITEQIKLMHRALFPSAEEMWHKYEVWLKADYQVQERVEYFADCGRVMCREYDGCTDTECERHYKMIPAYFDRDKYNADFETLPKIIKDYFFGSIESAKKLAKSSDETWEVSKNRFIKFYNNALIKCELQNSVPKAVIDKIQGKQNLQLERMAKSMVDKKKNTINTSDYGSEDTSDYGLEDIDNSELEWHQRGVLKNAVFAKKNLNLENGFLSFVNVENVILKNGSIGMVGGAEYSNDKSNSGKQ